MFAQSILGIWFFTGMIYHGQPMPPLNPGLKIYFQFDELGIDTLYYRRDGEVGFCERKATYTFANNKLIQNVFWVNPKNAESCTQDPDMQMGRSSTMPAEIIENKFYLKFQVGDEDLSYVWEKTDGLPLDQ